MAGPLSRRQVLALGVTASSVGTLAGCSALENESEPTVRLSDGFVIGNMSRSPVTVHVEISSDGTTHHESEHDIESAVYESSEDTYPTRTSGTRVSLGEWATESATYTVLATLDDGTSAEKNVAKEWSEPCILPDIMVSSGGYLSVQRLTCEYQTETPASASEDGS